MKTYRILFLIGKDRAGIVDELSRFLFERDANIEDSRMAAMGGRFCVVTLFSCSPEKIRIVEADLDGYGGQDAIDAVARGETQKVRLTRHLAQVVNEELNVSSRAGGLEVCSFPRVRWF